MSMSVSDACFKAWPPLHGKGSCVESEQGGGIVRDACCPDERLCWVCPLITEAQLCATRLAGLERERPPAERVQEASSLQAWDRCSMQGLSWWRAYKPNPVDQSRNEHNQRVGEKAHFEKAKKKANLVISEWMKRLRTGRTCLCPSACPVLSVDWRVTVPQKYTQLKDEWSDTSDLTMKQVWLKLTGMFHVWGRKKCLKESLFTLFP